MRQRRCRGGPSKAMRDGWYRSAEAKLVAYLKSKGYSDEDARWIAHETLLHVWEVHGSSIDPNKLDRDLVHLIAEMVAEHAAHDVRRVLMGEQLVSPAALPPDRIIESPEDEVIAAVDDEHAWRISKRDGRWLGALVAIFGLGAPWMKRITEKALIAAGTGTAVAAAVAGLTVYGLLPDDGAGQAPVDEENKAPIVHAIETATKRSVDGQRPSSTVSHPSFPLSSQPVQNTDPVAPEHTVPAASELELAADTGPGRKQSSGAKIDTPVGPVGVESGSDADGPAAASSVCAELLAECPGVHVATDDAPTTDDTPTP